MFYPSDVSTFAHPPGARHHLVSRGYQQNFASEDKRVALVSTDTGEVIDPQRAIKHNFAIAGFNDVELPEGGHDSSLEAGFAQIERPVLDQIRRLKASAIGSEQRGAVVKLFAMHLVRSQTFRRMHYSIVDQLRAEETPSYETDPEALKIFERQYGRTPAPGELEALAIHALDEMVAGNRAVAESTARQFDRISRKLDGLHMQFLWIGEERLPGFILGDAPVVHASVAEGRYGFRDKLALGDADLIIGPLTRRTAACFTASRLPAKQVTTKALVKTINCEFWRAAEREVACHPDDVPATRRLHTNLDRFSIDRFRGQ